MSIIENGKQQPLTEEIRQVYKQLCAAPRSIQVIRDEILLRADGAALIKALIRKCGSLRQFSEKVGCDRASLSTELSRNGVDYKNIWREGIVPGLELDDDIGEAAQDISRRDIRELQTYVDDLEVQLETTRNWYEQFGAIIGRIAAEHPPQIIKAPKYFVPDTEADEELAFIHTADFHIGELVRPSDTAGLSSYNFEIFQQRRQIFQNAIDRIINGMLRKVYPIKNCIITCLGDVVTGEDIFPKQMNRIDMPLMQQIFKGAIEIADMILFFCGMFENVWLYLVPGNHGRTQTTDVNTDIILYMFIAAYLRSQPNLHIVISDSGYCGIYIDKDTDFVPFDKDNDRTWNYLFTHGDAARGFMGIPYYGMDRMVRRLSESTRVVWDRVFAGHHHDRAEAARWTIIGAWPGGTEYSMGKMQAVSRPQQLLHGFHPKQGITWQFPIYLAEQPRLTKDSEETVGLYTPKSELMSLIPGPEAGANTT